MKCRQCGAEVPDTDRFCTECGNDLEKQRQEEQEEAEKTAAEVNENAEIVGNDTEASSNEQEAVQEEPQDTDEAEKKSEDDGLHCSHCGAEIVPGDKFCTKCGQSIVDEPVEQKEAQAVPASGDPEQHSAVQQGQQGAPQGGPRCVQQPYPQPGQQYAQPLYQQGQPYPPQQGQYQQAVPNGYYGQPQYQQYPPQQYAQQPGQNNFYGQPYQAAPQNQPLQADAAAEKEKRGKTPFWVWIIIGVLAAAIIFCIVWFFVVPHTNSSNSANVEQAQTEQGEANGSFEAPSRTYINQNSSNADDAESALEETTKQIVIDTRNGWRNPNLMSGVELQHYRWSGNSLVITALVDINTNNSYNFISTINCEQYYTYVRFNNIYYENGQYHYESSSRPHGKLLNLYTDVTGDHHKVAGYLSEDAAFSAAGV